MTATAEEDLTPEILRRLAAQMGLSLTPERASDLVGRVQDTFAFTGELDQLAPSDVVPASVFVPLDG